MGQRHQLFIIARIGQRYRSLAAVHHQWLYGVSAVTRCLRLVRLFSDPSNRLALQQELIAAEHYYKDNPETPDLDWQAEQDETSCPFPFVTTCLVVGASCDPATGQCQAVHQQPFGVAYNQGDNNNGITVLDITDLDALRYCFVDYHGMESKREVPLHTPLSAWTYLLAYYDSNAPIVQYNLPALKALEKVPLVTVAALSSAWPNGKWQVPEDRDELVGPLGALSLVTSSIKTLLAGTLDAESPVFDAALLEEPLKIPGFKSALRDYLLSMADKITHRSNEIALLQVIFSGERHVDLSYFTNLSINDIKLILHHPHIATSVSAVSLPIRTSASPADIAAALPSSGIAELYCLGSPDINSADAFASLYLTKLVTNRLVTHRIFGAGLAVRPWLSPEPDRGSAGQVLQFILRAPSCGRDPAPHLSIFFLGDALLSPTRFVSGFYDFISFQAESMGFSDKEDVIQATLALTSAPPVLWPRGGGGGEVGPLPAALRHAGEERRYLMRPGSVAGRLRDMAPGTWSAVLVKNKEHNMGDGDYRSTMTFKFGLVRPRKLIAGKAGDGRVLGIGDFEVFNVKQYLECVQPGSSEGLEELQASCKELVEEGENRVVLEDIEAEEVLELLMTAIGGSSKGEPAPAAG